TTLRGGGDHRPSSASGGGNLGLCQARRCVLPGSGLDSDGQLAAKLHRQRPGRRIPMMVINRKNVVLPPCSVERRRGVILLAVLVVVAILTLIAYRFLTLMNAEHEAAYATNRVMQGRYIADSGLQYAAFVLSYPQLRGLSDAPDETSGL